MDLVNVDPDLVREFGRLITGVSWGGGVIVAAIALKLGGPALAEIFRALRGRDGG